MLTNRTTLCGALAFLTCVVTACAQDDSADRSVKLAPRATNADHDRTAPAISPELARTIAADAYIYGVPLVSIYQTMYAFSIDKDSPQFKGPFNSVLNVSRVFTPEDTSFVTPNSDTPYTFIGLDLRAEPMVLTIPKMEKERYFVFQLMDLYTYNFAYIGTRTTGNDGGTFLIAGPRWDGEAPSNITKIIRSETDLVNVVGRTQLFNPGDIEKVKAIQAGYKVQPLSMFSGTSAPAAAPAITWPKPLPPEQQRSSPEFFNLLAFLLQFAQPANPDEAGLLARFGQLGIRPGQPFDASSLSPEIQTAIKAGMEEGQARIDAKRASLGGKTDTLFGDRAFLRNDYLARATGTQVGIGANSREEALYPILDKDADGQALDASKSNYTLRFAPGQLPPVHAFWSVTMYDLPRQLLVPNPIDRYLINSPMLPSLKKDPDGGLTLYIQAESPGKDKEANWLPAPRGPFVMFMRYYWPKEELLEGKWSTPKIVASRHRS